MSKMCFEDTSTDFIEQQKKLKEVFSKNVKKLIKLYSTTYNISESKACDEIAGQIGVIRSTVTNWKNAKKLPEMKHLIKLSIIMKCEPYELLTHNATFSEEDIDSLSKIHIPEKQANRISDANSYSKWLENYRIIFHKLGISKEVANVMYSQTHKQQPQTLFGPSLPIINYWSPFDYLIGNKEFLATYMEKMNNFADKILICSLDNQISEKIQKAKLDTNNEIYFDKQYEKLKDNVPSNIKKDLEDFEKYLIENSLNVYKKHVMDVFNTIVN